MEVSELVGNQYALHGIIAGFVLFLAILVFAFGFKSAEEPPFDKLTSSHDERKSTGKKKKIKDKKSQSNGHATAVIDSTKQTKSVEKASPSKDKNSPAVKKSPVKNALKETKANSTRDAELKEKKPKSKGKENVEIKAKKKVADEKPKDYDDGEWEQVLSSKDKKNRKTVPDDILPLKTDKKKEKKKLKEPEDEPVAEPIEKQVEEVVIEEIKVEAKPVSQKVEAYSTVIEEIIPVDDKPKKSKKKKQAPEPPKQAAAAELPQPSPKPQKKQKPEITASKIEPFEIPTEIVSEPSAAAFDEMGDAWKEAKAPKKSNKKKSRKD